MSGARPFCRASSMVTATWKIFTASFISIWELPPAPISNSTKTARGLWRKSRAPLWEKFAGRASGCQAGRSAASAPAMTPFGSRTARDNIIVTTPERSAQAVQRKKDLGCDILKVNEFLSLDLVKVAVDEAHRLGHAGSRPQLGCCRFR